MHIPGRKKISARIPDDGPVYLTHDGHKRLTDELARLTIELPTLALEAQRTAAYGDRSENAEYKEAKSMLRRVQRRIWNIEDRLKRSEMIPIGKNSTGKIALGSTVVLESDTNTRTTYQILGPHETNPVKGRISHLSPLGATLIGKKQGEIATVQTPNGSHSYLILKVS
ncbi:MAG: transcription elongation factor GreA [Patescibacteria group bacterium]